MEKMSQIPKLRFPEFNGEWEREKFKNLTFKVGIRNKDSIKYPIYSINNKEGFIPQSEQFEGMDSNVRGYDISLYKIIEKNTFAYNPARINVGSIGYSGKLNNVIVSSLYVCFKTKDLIDDYFLLHYLKTISFNKAVVRNLEGGVRDYLFYENFCNIKINITGIPEQTKIASFFTAIDEKISQLKKKKSLLDQYKKGVMQKIFSQELRFKDENGNDFPEWEMKKLGEIAEIKTGNKDTQNKEENGLYSFFVRSDIIARINSYSFDGEAILTSGDGVGVGKNFHYINGRFDFHQRVYSIRNFAVNVFAKFIFYFFSTFFYDRVKRLSAKNSVDSVRLEMISEMPISLPSYSEQTKIANFLTSIDHKINFCHQQIEKTELWKKGLMQKMFC